MTGDDLKRFRERTGASRDELASAINQALGKNYNGETIARWERGRPITKAVGVFLQELAVSDGITPPLEQPVDGLEPDDLPLDDGATDTPPGPGLPPAQPKVLSGGAWSTACEELVELIATGVGLVGAGIGSQALMLDGAIIAQDKAALGAAWGKLAETNDTFRRMLVGMTEGGAWLQVALVTGTTFSKCWQSHQALAAGARAHARDSGADLHDVAAA